MAAQPTTSTEQRPRRDYLALTGVLPGTAAIFAGALYAIGGLARAGELAANHFSVQQTLPLTPLQQILARGLAVLLDPKVLAAALLFLWPMTSAVQAQWTANWLHARLKKRARGSEVDARQSRSDALALESEVLAQIERCGAPADTIQRYHQRLSALVERNGASPPKELVLPLIRAIRLLGRDIMHDGRAYGVKGTQLSRLAREHRGWWASDMILRAGQNVNLRAVLIAALTVLIILTPLDAVPYYLALLGWVLILSSERVLRLPRNWRLATGVVPILFAIAVGAYLSAPALPRVTLRLQASTPVKGSLIAAPGTDGTTWYVGTAPRRVRAVSADRVLAADLYPAPKSAKPFAHKTLASVLLDAVFK